MQNLTPRRRLNPSRNPLRRRFPALVLVLVLASGGPDAKCSPAHDAGFGGGWSCPDGYKRHTPFAGKPKCVKKQPPRPQHRRIVWE